MNEQTGLSTADFAGNSDPEQRTSQSNGRTMNGNGATNGAATAEAERSALLSPSKADDFRSRWDNIQGSFVDEPRQAVKQADGLVAEAMQHLAEVFSEERSKLEQQWSSGGEVSTDDLRVALQRYRSFFQRLLAV